MTVIVEVALGDPDPAVDSDQYDWSDWSDYIELDSAGLFVWRGYRDGSDDPTATEIRFRGKNGDLRWHIEHANNPYFGLIHERTPIRVSRNFGGVTQRAMALLAEVTIIEDAAGAYLAADIVAYGRMYFEESQPVTQSILYAQFSSFVGNGLVAYWPGEDPARATRLRSAVPGQPDVTFLQLIETASDSDVVGSKPLWRFSDDVSQLRAYVAPYERPSPEAWTVQIAVKVPEEPAGTQPFFAIYDKVGTIRRWLLSIVPGTPALVEVRGENAAGADVLTGTRTIEFTKNGVEPWGQLVGVTIGAVQSGADVDWTLRCENGQLGTVTAQTLGPVWALAAGPDAGINDWTMGHWAIWNDTDSSLFINFDGFVGEDLFTAWFRAATDAGIPVAIAGTATTTSTAGVLESDTPINRLKLLTHSEGGLMYEDVRGNAVLALRTDLEAATPALTIDYGDNQIMTLMPIRDGFRRANRVTLTNQGGGGAVADAPVPYDPATVGYVLDKPMTVNLQDATQAQSAAEFEVAQLSHPDLRHRISLEFLGPAAGLRANYLANVDIGSRILITNGATHSALDDIDQQVMGIEEWHSALIFRATLNTRPVALWRDAFIAETGAGNLSRADTSGSSLLAAVDDNDTALLVGTHGNPGDRSGKWSTTAVPYDLALRTRDRVTCTAVTNRTPVFVAVGAAAHADYADITPGAAAGMATGDCELLFTAIRDSGGFAHPSGVAERRKIYTYDQTGWRRLVRFGGSNGSIQLWARTWQSAILTPPPTIVPLSGAAGDTVSAQTCAFRYVQPVIHTRALGLSNSAAVDIAYPGVGIVRPACVAIMVAQRYDDWTSAAAAGWTEIGEPDSTLGADHGLAWYYQIQTTAANIAPGSVTITGGGPAVSFASVVSLISDVQTLTVTRGVNSAITSHPVGADVRLWRAGRVTR